MYIHLGMLYNYIYACIYEYVYSQYIIDISHYTYATHFQSTESAGGKWTYTYVDIDYVDKICRHRKEDNYTILTWLGYNI